MSRDIKLHTVAYFLFLVGVFTFSDKPSTIWIFYIFALFYALVSLIYILQQQWVVIVDGWGKANVLFILWMSLSFLWQHSTEIYAQRVITVTIIVFFSFLTTQYARKKEDVQMIIKCIVFANVINCVYRLFNGGILQVLGRYETDEILVVGANNLAMMVVITFSLAIYCYRETKSIVYLGAATLFLVVALMTASRKALIGIALALVVQYIIKDRHYIKNLVISGILLAIFVMIFTRVEMFEYTWERLQRMLEYSQGKMGGDASLATRIEYIQRGLKAFLHQPVWGYGVGYSYTNLTGSAHTYLHNNYLEICVSLGIVGLILYYAQYVMIFVNAMRKHISNNFRVTIITLLVTFLFVLDVGAVTYFEKYTLITLHLLYRMTLCTEKE